VRQIGRIWRGEIASILFASLNAESIPIAAGMQCGKHAAGVIKKIIN
jgi:hypothetical protein